MEQADSSAERDFRIGRKATQKWHGRHCLETAVMLSITLKENVYGKRVLSSITCHDPLTTRNCMSILC